MTLQNIRDIFTLELKILSNIRGTKEITLGDRQVAYLYSKALSDVCNRLKIATVNNSVSLTAATSYTTYALNSKFNGLMTQPEIGGIKLEEVALGDIPQTGTLQQGQPTKFSIFYDNTTNLHRIAVYPLPDAAYTLSFWSYVDLGMMDATDLTAQNWGQFDGSQLQGDMYVPERYTTLVVLGMLASLDNEKKLEYENEIMKMRNSGANSIRGTKYRFGI